MRIGTDLRSAILQNDIFYFQITNNKNELVATRKLTIVTEGQILEIDIFESVSENHSKSTTKLTPNSLTTGNSYRT